MYNKQITVQLLSFGLGLPTVMHFLYVFFFLSLQIIATKAISGYYWRDYSAKIPQDAVVGGDDVSGKPTYIGQTYIHNLGVFIMQIFPGQSNTDLAAYGVKKPSAVQKILCSKYPEHFSWMSTSAKTFQLDTTGKHVVMGGFDHVDANKGMVHVGRLAYQGGMRIGSVLGYSLENAVFSFIGGTTEQKATAYEVLLFDAKELALFKSNTSVCVF